MIIASAIFFPTYKLIHIAWSNSYGPTKIVSVLPVLFSPNLVMDPASMDFSASAVVAPEDQQESAHPPKIVAPVLIDPECDIVLAWLHDLCASPPDGNEEIRLPVGDHQSETPEDHTPYTVDLSPAATGDSVSSPPSREDAVKDAPLQPSGVLAGAAARSPDDDGDKEVDQNLANIAAIELLKSCFTLPAEFFAASRDCQHCRSSSSHDGSVEPASYMISSLSMQCYHCSFPTGLAARPRNHVDLPWRNGFDGPGGGSGSEPPTEDSKIPPTPDSTTKLTDKGSNQTSTLQDIGKHHWFRHGRKRRLPRILHVTECSHPDEPPDTVAKTESDTEESSGPDISKTLSAPCSAPESEGHGGKTERMKNAVSKTLRSLSQKLRVSAPDPRPSSAGHTPFRSPVLKPRHFNELDSPALTASHSLSDPVEIEGGANKAILLPNQADPPSAPAEAVDEAGGPDKSTSGNGGGGGGGGITLTDKDDSPPKSTVPPNTPASVASAGFTTPIKSPTVPASGQPPMLWVPPNTPQSAADKSREIHGLARLPYTGKSSLSRSSTNKEGGGERVFKLTPEQETHDYHDLSQALATKEDSSLRDANVTSITHTPGEDHHHHQPVPRPILSHYPLPPPPPPPPSSEGAASTPSPSSAHRRVSFDVKQLPEHEPNHIEVSRLPEQPPTETASTAASISATSTASPSPIEDKTPPGRIRNWPSSLAASSPGTLGTRPSVTSTSSSPALRQQSDFVHGYHYPHHHHYHPHPHVDAGDIETHNLRRHSDVTNLMSKQKVSIEEPSDDDVDDGESEPESEEEDEVDWGREWPLPPRPRAGSLVGEMGALWREHQHAKQRGEVEDRDEDDVWEGDLDQPVAGWGVTAAPELGAGGRRRSSGTVNVLEKIESGTSSDAGDRGEEEYFPCRSRMGSELGAVEGDVG